MAVPKKKKSKMKTRSRRASSWPLARGAAGTCENCGAIKRPHRVCDACGVYRGRSAVSAEA